MNCPLCIDQSLVPNYRAGIEIDVCPQCKGVWLDRGELDKLAQTSDLAPRVQDTLTPSSFAPSGKSAKSAKSGDKKKSDKKAKKKKKKSSLDRLGDILEDVLDL